MKKLLASTVLAASLAVTGACTSSATTAGGDNAVAEYNKVTGNLEVTVSSSLENAYRASKAGLESLQYRITEDAKDALQARIVAKEATDKTNTVFIKKRADNVTDITVSVGAFGDETKARLILDEIKRRL